MSFVIQSSKTVDLTTYETFVRGLGEKRDPNFAGCATVLARRLIGEGHRENALFLLQMAVESYPFSKEEQVRDATAYFAELGTQLGAAHRELVPSD